MSVVLLTRGRVLPDYCPGGRGVFRFFCPLLWHTPSAVTSAGRPSQSARLDTPAGICDPARPSDSGRRRKVMADPHGPPRRRLSLVIPAYNEEAGIRQAVAEADEALARLAP